MDALPPQTKAQVDNVNLSNKNLGSLYSLYQESISLKQKSIHEE